MRDYSIYQPTVIATGGNSLHPAEPLQGRLRVRRRPPPRRPSHQQAVQQHRQCDTQRCVEGVSANDRGKEF